MTAVDRLGFNVRLKPRRVCRSSHCFPAGSAGCDGIQKVLVEMVQQARQAALRAVVRQNIFQEKMPEILSDHGHFR